MSALTEMLAKLPPSIMRQEATTTQAKLLKAFADQLDEIESVENDLKILLVIDTATGKNLDSIGEILKEPRRGRTDADYRIFLNIAITQKRSGGDIESLNQIARALGFTNINIVELFAGLRWDGTRLLDGGTLMTGGNRPATFGFFRDINVDDTTGNLAIATSFDKTRAGGVFDQINFTFTSNQSQGVDYTSYSSVWDGSVLLDGETAMNPNKIDFTPDYMALGDGAVGEPGGGDTALVNEVLRKAVVTEDGPDGRFHSIEVEQTELDGVTINEMAIFKGSSMIWADAFTGKLKDDQTIFIFRMKETD